MRTWESIDEKLTKTLEIIFKGYELNKLSSYDKRKIIFEYLTRNLEYDYAMLERIKAHKAGKIQLARDSAGEFDSVINNNVGICNGISQYYKLLLEKVGIKAYCVICSDGSEVGHQLNLVYDGEHGTYSFDDVTSVIVNRGTADEYFDYDLEFANSVNQGNAPVVNGQHFVILPEGWVNFLVCRDNSLSENLTSLPNNIVSVKGRYQK